MQLADDPRRGGGIAWGRAGVLYFCVPARDLAADRFDRVEIFLQVP